MSDKPLKVAVVGAGMIANNGHLPAWQNLREDFEVVGVADIVEERAQHTAQVYQVPHAYADWRKMLAELKPDMVSVCTPNVYHKEATIAALKGGAHVFCEKPITTCTADAVEMFDTAKAAGRLLFVAQTVRFSNAFVAAKELADSGKLGEMYYAEAYTLRRRGVPKWGTFHMKEHSAGGPLFDVGVHYLDLLLWIMGSPKAVAVSSMTYRKLGHLDEGVIASLAGSGAPGGVFMPRPYDHREFDVEDFASGYIRLENNATVGFKACWAANVTPGRNIFVAGTEGGLELFPLRLLTNMDRYQVDMTPTVPPDRDVIFHGHWAATEHVLRVLRGEEEMIVKREQVLNVMRTLDAMYRSAAEGREVWLD